MSRLREDQLERLLREARDWESEPPASLPSPIPAPTRRGRLLGPSLALGSAAAMAALATLTLLRPTPAPQAPQSAMQTAQTVPSPTPGASLPVMRPQALAGQKAATQIAQYRPRRRARLSRHQEEPAPTLRRKSSRKRRSARIRPMQNELQLAPYRYVSESKPLPPGAISLDESPKIVPLVIAEPDEETGEVRLRPAVATIPDRTGEPISLE